MDNTIISEHLQYLKNNFKLSKYNKKTQSYKFMKVEYTKLEPYSYTIVLDDTHVITEINNQVESIINIKRGDYVICGPKGEKYGLPLDKILSIYNLEPITNKPIEKNGFQLNNINGKNKNDEIEIIASWGEKQNLKIGDYILLENDNKSFYGVEKEIFNQTYNKI